MGELSQRECLCVCMCCVCVSMPVPVRLCLLIVPSDEGIGGAVLEDLDDVELVVVLADVGLVEHGIECLGGAGVDLV